MDFNTVKTKFEGKKPNLGGLELNLIAKDDAMHVKTVPVDWIEYGIEAMPFLHPWFALDYFKTHCQGSSKSRVERFELIFTLSRIRNHRLMRKINAVIAQHEGKLPFTIPDDPNITQVIADAARLGVDTSKYLDETSDADDVEQCTNSWCLNQNAECGKAVDNVMIINDLDNVDWFVLIVRQNGPGRAQLAWAGGFVDKGESFREAALREKDEETEVSIIGRSNVTYTTTTTDLTPVQMPDWDVRAKFVRGMMVGATVTHTRFSAATPAN